jgi:hypothetical protein
MLKSPKVIMNAVLRMAAIEAMPQSDRVALFATKDAARNRLFIELAKLFRAIEAGLTGKQKIFPMLEKAGVKKGSVSNASLASKVYDLVTSGKITEDEFDSLTWADCVAIIRVMSAPSKKRLTADEVAAHVKTGTDFEPDLAELYATGLTLAEKVEADKAAAKAEEKAKADAKVAEIKAAADLKAVQAENAKLTKQVAANAPPQVVPTAHAVEVPEPVAIETVEPVEAPANIVAMAPPPPRTRTAADLCNTLDSVFSDMADLNPEEQAVVAGKLMELADIVALSGIIQTPTEQAAPAASKRKAA